MKAIILLMYLLISSLSHSQSGWFEQSSGTNYNLKSVCFIDEYTGWAAGDSGVIIHTSNGGINWVLQNSNTSRRIDKILFSDFNNGLAVGNYYEYNPWCFAHSIRLVTTDGGSTWSIQHEGQSANIEDFSQTNNNTFFIAYEGSDCYYTIGAVVKTTDGANWIPLSTPGPYSYAYKSVSFINSETGWAVGYFAADFGLRIHHLIKTTDGGNSWEYIRRDSNTYNPDYWGKNMRFLNSNTGYLTESGYRNIKKTTDGGYTWNQTDSLATAGRSAYYFIDPATGWSVGGNGSIIRTDNGGANWTEQISSVTDLLNSVYFVNNYVGYVAGNDGLILKTISGGLTSAGQISAEIPSAFSLDQNYPNPFNPTTVIQYSLSENSFASLKIYNSLGIEINTLVSRNQNAGNYKVTFDAPDLSSGIYYYSLYVNESLAGSKRMVLLK